MSTTKASVHHKVVRPSRYRGRPAETASPRALPIPLRVSWLHGEFIAISSFFQIERNALAAALARMYFETYGCMYILSFSSLVKARWKIYIPSPSSCDPCSRLRPSPHFADRFCMRRSRGSGVDPHVWGAKCGSLGRNDVTCFTKTTPDRPHRSSRLPQETSEEASMNVPALT
jgi:hypothetical protein